MHSVNDESNHPRFPLPVVVCSFDTCKKCKYCCQWCKYLGPTGCAAPSDYALLDLCRSFPILIGSPEGRNPSLGIGADQFASKFGAFVPLGNHCLATSDERQRAVFQLAAKWLNEGQRQFTIFLAEDDFFVLIEVKEPRLNSESTLVSNSPTHIVESLLVRG